MKIWAHRGCSYRYPENTLSAFRKALNYEITGIELDIQLSRDGHIVVMHDETVDRTTDHSGWLKDYTLAELKAMHIRGDDNEHVPTIREVLELIRDDCVSRGILLNIELKNSEVRYEGMEQMILDLVREYGMEPYIIYSSFNPESVAMLKKMRPDLHVGALAEYASRCLEIAEAAGADALHPFIKRIDIPDLKTRTDKPVRAWNVTHFEPFYPDGGDIEVQDTAALEAAGITDIFTNAPELYVPRHG